MLICSNNYLICFFTVERDKHQTIRGRKTLPQKIVATVKKPIPQVRTTEVASVNISGEKNLGQTRGRAKKFIWYRTIDQIYSEERY